MKNYVRTLRVNVTAPPLTGLKASSGANMDVTGPYTVDNLQLEVSSGATLKAGFTATTLQAQVSSGGGATVSGKIQRLNVRTSSGGVFKGDNLHATVCEASASTGGNIAVAVQETLTAEASTEGSVRYTGAPQVTKHTSIGGSVSNH